MSEKISTSNHAVNVLRDSQLPVSECWFQIGCELGVPLEIRRQQKTKALMTTDYWGALEECIDWWLRNNPDPSWEKLTSIIEKIDRCAAENMIRNTVKVDDRMFQHVNNNYVRSTTPILRDNESPRRRSSCKADTATSFSWSFCKISLVPASVIVLILASYYSGFLQYLLFLILGILVVFFYFCGGIREGKKRRTDKSNNNNNTGHLDLEQRIWTPGETGTDVVKKCIEKLDSLRDAGVFPDDKNFMRRLAFVMSRDGNASFKLHNDGGIWQVSRYAFDDTKDELEHIRLPRKYQKLQDTLRIKDWRNITMVDLEKPMYSALAARLYLSNFAEAIPPSFKISKQQEYWWRFYMLRHEGKGKMSENDFTTGVTAMMQLGLG